MMIVNYNRVDRKHCYTTTTGGGGVSFMYNYWLCRSLALTE